MVQTHSFYRVIWNQLQAHACVCAFFGLCDLERLCPLWPRERERERGREREREREREGEREKERERERERKRERQRETERDRGRDTERERAEDWHEEESFLKNTVF